MFPDAIPSQLLILIYNLPLRSETRSAKRLIGNAVAAEQVLHIPVKMPLTDLPH